MTTSVETSAENFVKMKVFRLECMKVMIGSDKWHPCPRHKWDATHMHVCIIADSTRCRTAAGPMLALRPNMPWCQSHWCQSSIIFPVCSVSNHIARGVAVKAGTALKKQGWNVRLYQHRWERRYQHSTPLLIHFVLTKVITVEEVQLKMYS